MRKRYLDIHKMCISGSILLVNGGGINLDVNKLIDQLNPLKWCYFAEIVFSYILPKR